MARSPKNRGIAQVQEDKTLILRSLRSLRLIHSLRFLVAQLEPITTIVYQRLGHPPP